MLADIEEILFTEDQIQRRVSELGKEISQDYVDRELILVSVLRGGVFFLADLSRSIVNPLTLDFIAIASYGSISETSGVVRVIKDLEEPIEGKDVLIVEDVVDTGLTLQYLIRTLRTRHPRSLEICTLLDKSARRIVDLPLRYRGFEVPDVYVVGYGLDYEQRFRNLPYIAVLRQDVVYRDG